MARIRSVKPEFWTDGDITDCSPWARLFFIGTWNFALCDNGHLPDDPRRLKMQIFPADDVDAGALVEELIAAGRLVRLQIGDRSFLHIKRLADHQKTEKRWAPRCPACQASTTPDPDETPGTSPNLPETPATSDPERVGKEGRVAAAAATRASTGPVDRAPTPAAAASDLAPELELLRSRLEARNLFVRWDRLTPEAVAETIDLIELHGDAALVKAAMNAYRPDDPPKFAQAWLGDWRNLPDPTKRLAAVKDPPCTEPGHSGTTKHCIQCAADRKAAR